MTVNPSKDQIAEHLINHIIDKITIYLIEDYGYTLKKALDIIYSSSVMDKLQQKDNELYIQSPAYVYELLQKTFACDVPK